MKLRVMNEVETPEGVGTISEFNEWGECRVWFPAHDCGMNPKSFYAQGKYKWFKREDVKAK